MPNTQGAYVVHTDENGNPSFRFFSNENTQGAGAHIADLDADGTPYKVMIPGMNKHNQAAS
jgi:hypothetical protein